MPKTKPRGLPLPASAIRDLRDGKGVVWVEMEKQPKRAYSLKGMSLSCRRDPVFGTEVIAPVNLPIVQAMQMAQWITKEFPKPPVLPGETVFVQEAWCETEDPLGIPIIAYQAGGAQVIGATGEKRDGTWKEHLCGEHEAEVDIESWQPASQMPRWASRFTLHITSVTPTQRDGVWGWEVGIKLENEHGKS